MSTIAKISDSRESFLLNEQISIQDLSIENINTFANEVNANLFPRESKFAGSAHFNIKIREKSVGEVWFFWPNKYFTSLARKTNKNKNNQLNIRFP